MDTVAVTLIVKAPNQQIEDQTIKCELTWTIKKLKGYLSEVYPSKPSTDEQKLIYSGQLLPDTVVLKDILRQYEGQETHTVHLVCTQTRDTYDFQRKLNSSSATPKPSMASENREAQNIVSEAMTDIAEPDGLRQRLNANGISAQDGSDVINQDGFVPAQQNARSTDLEQQMVWLQQTYSQYLYQYMQLVHMGVSPEEVYMQALQLQEPLFQGAPLNTAPPTAAQNPQAAHQHEQNNAAPVANMNNPVGGVAVNEEVEQDRDWLDWFYFMSRVMVLFSIVYFYSSPMRFLIVLVLGALIYLYQMGFFRNPTVEIHNEHAENVENNNVLPQVNVVGNPLNPPAQPAAAENANSERPNATNEQTTPEPEPPTIFALAWTFVSTFFASLIPDAPNAI